MKTSSINNVPTSRTQNGFRYLLGIFLMTAGTGHLTFARKEFQAQVPDWVPVNKDLTVVLSGIVEIMLGMAIAFWSKKKVFWGWIAAAFFIAIFPGNIEQYTRHKDMPGLDNDTARLVRLFFQPVLIAWALWSTGAWMARKGLKNLI